MQLGRKKFLILIIILLFTYANPSQIHAATITVNAQVDVSDLWAREIADQSIIAISSSSKVGENMVITFTLGSVNNVHLSNQKIIMEVFQGSKLIETKTGFTDKQSSVHFTFIPQKAGRLRFVFYYDNNDMAIKINHETTVQVNNALLPFTKAVPNTLLLVNW